MNYNLYKYACLSSIHMVYQMLNIKISHACCHALHEHVGIQIISPYFMTFTWKVEKKAKNKKKYEWVEGQKDKKKGLDRYIKSKVKKG